MGRFLYTMFKQSSKREGNMQPTLVVLAAGMGSRYGGLKQLDPVGPSGEFILDYSVFDAIKAGFDKVIFIIRKDIEEIFKEKIGSRYEGKIKVEYVYQELNKLPNGFKVPDGRQKPWGTGHATLMVKDICKTPFSVLNADDFYGRSSFQLMADHFKKYSSEPNVYGIPAYLVGNTLSEHGSVSRGVCSVSNGELKDVVERVHIEKKSNQIVYVENGVESPLAANTLVSMNMWGINPNFFGYLEELFTEFLKSKGNELKSEFFLPSAIDSLIRKKKISVKVYESKEVWVGVTYPEDKKEVVNSIRQKINQKVYPEDLWKK